jgi:hypothetical protein
MDVVSLGPLRAGSIVWQPRPGAWTLTVACKATYVLEPHESPLADAQDEPTPADAYPQDDRSRSLWAASDLAPFKPRADVTLVGHACASSGRPTATLVPRMIVGTIDKAIEVFPDRSWTQDGQLREGARFLRMPLVYERAAGGPGTTNPVGVPAAGAPDRHGRVAIPNLVAPGVHVSAPGQYLEPAGFGPIAPWWPSRLDRLHRHGASWSHRDWAQQPMPADMDFGYFNAAPVDQQLDVLRSNERLVLEDMHAQHARLVTSLPGVHPRAVVERRAGSSDEVLMRCDTLGIDLDRGVCWLVWRGQIALEDLGQPGRVLISTEGLKPGAPGARPPPARRPTHQETAVVAPTEAAKSAMAALPFRHSTPPPAELPFRPSTPPPAELPAAPAIPPPLVPSLGREMAGPLPPALVREAAAIGAMPAAATSSPWTTPGARASSPSLEADVAGSGVLAASNLAAAAAVVTPSAPGPGAAAASTIAAAPARDGASGPPLELIWHDPAFLPRVRKNPLWASLFKPPPRKPPPSKAAAQAPPDPPPEAAEEAARRDLAAVLGGGSPVGAAELDELVTEALGAGGTLTPPLTLVAGELELPFDEIETLEAVVAAATPLAAVDPRLKEALDAAAEALKADLRGAPEVVDGLVLRVREAWSKANRLLPPTYLDAHAERVLLSQRHYQKRELLDAAWIRGVIHQGGGPDGQVPAYLPASLAKKLPLFKRFAARAVVEALPRQDQYESHPVALRVVALARSLARSPRARG